MKQIAKYTFIIVFVTSFIMSIAELKHSFSSSSHKITKGFINNKKMIKVDSW